MIDFILTILRRVECRQCKKWVREADADCLMCSRCQGKIAEWVQESGRVMTVLL